MDQRLSPRQAGLCRVAAESAGGLHVIVYMYLSFALLCLIADLCGSLQIHSLRYLLVK